MEISVFDENAAPFEADVHLSAEEADALVHDTYARLARVFKCAEADAPERAQHFLTARELQTFLKETVMARAADRALRAAGPLFVGAPRTEAADGFREHAPFSFRLTAHPVPAMNLDMETPIERRRKKKPARTERPPAQCDGAQAGAADAPGARNADGDRSARERLVAETLRARLNGTIPDALIRDALARKKAEFEAELGEAGLTYREYRIAHRVKPKDVQDALYDEAFDELARDIALDTVFVAQTLATTPEDEQAVLADMAPGREASLRRELESTGKLWMLSQKTRRAAALRWAVDHLLQE